MLLIMGLKDIPMTTKAFLAKWAEKYPNATRLDLPKQATTSRRTLPKRW